MDILPALVKPLILIIMPEKGNIRELLEAWRSKGPKKLSQLEDATFEGDDPLDDGAKPGHHVVKPQPNNLLYILQHIRWSLSISRMSHKNITILAGNLKRIRQDLAQIKEALG